MSEKVKNCNSCAWDNRTFCTDGNVFLGCKYAGIVIQAEVLTQDIACPYHKTKGFKTTIKEVENELSSFG